MNREWALTQPLLEILVAGLRMDRLQIQRHVRKGRISMYYEDDHVMPMLIAWIPITIWELGYKFPYRNGVMRIRVGRTEYRIPILDSEYEI